MPVPVVKTSIIGKLFFFFKIKLLFRPGLWHTWFSGMAIASCHMRMPIACKTVQKTSLCFVACGLQMAHMGFNRCNDRRCSSAASHRLHCETAAVRPGDVISDSLTATSNETRHSAAEMYINGVIQDEVEREVDSLKCVTYSSNQVVRVVQHVTRILQSQ